MLLLLTAAILAGSFIYRYLRHREAVKMGVEVGAFVPDIILPDTSGRMVGLSSLKGKYVLVDFWASWCRPCRREIPNQMMAYGQFSEKKMKNGSGFTIFYVSLDENEELWKGTIRDEGMKGPVHVSDLKGWSSPVVETYRIKSIPNNLLLNPEGKVLAVHLKGKALQSELSKFAE